MRLLLEVAYNKILFGKGAPVAELIASLDGAKLVDEKGGWGEPKKFVVKDDAEFTVKIINDDAIELPENSNGMYEQFHKIAQERDEAKKRVSDLEKKLKAIETATASSV